MQNIIVEILLGIVVVMAVLILTVIGRKNGGMTKKQKKMMIRILIASAALLGLQFLPAELFDTFDRILFKSAGRIIRLILYLAVYAVIGYDILIKAWKGIKNLRPFDECFLMTVATLGALAIAVYENGDYVESIAVTFAGSHIP